MAPIIHLFFDFFALRFEERIKEIFREGHLDTAMSVVRKTNKRKRQYAIRYISSMRVIPKP